MENKQMTPNLFVSADLGCVHNMPVGFFVAFGRALVFSSFHLFFLVSSA